MQGATLQKGKGERGGCKVQHCRRVRVKEVGAALQCVHTLIRGGADDEHHQEAQRYGIVIDAPRLPFNPHKSLTRIIFDLVGDLTHAHQIKCVFSEKLCLFEV